MPSRPTKICSGNCGKMVWIGKSSLENPMCQPCRRKNNPKRMCIDCGKETSTRKIRNFESHPAICRDCLIHRTKTSPEHQRERAANNCAIRRARKLGTVVEKFDRKEIFERDNYVCHICDEPTDATVRHPSPLAPTIDHVIPLAKGGTHTRDNIKTAHSRCNVAKGIKVLSLAN